MCKQEIDSRVIVNGSWTCEDCGSLVGDVDTCPVCEGAADDVTADAIAQQTPCIECGDMLSDCQCGWWNDEDGEAEAEYQRDLMLEQQEREDFCECDESYGYFGEDY